MYIANGFDLHALRKVPGCVPYKESQNLYMLLKVSQILQRESDVKDCHYMCCLRFQSVHEFTLSIHCI